MKLIVCKNYEELSKTAASMVAEQIKQNPHSVLGLATGETPMGMYEELVKKYEQNEIDFEKIRAVNLSEFYPISKENKNSYNYYMNEKLFSRVNIDKENTYILNGECNDTDKECREYDEKIAELGGIDLQILGIGRSGYVGFNEPGENLSSFTHLANLTQNTINANAKFFGSPEAVPKTALTMGIGSIMRSKKIILLVSGRSKSKVVKQLLTGMISTDMPASLLHAHGDVTLICDSDAYEIHKLGIDIGGTEIKFGVLDNEKNLIFKDSVSTPCGSAEEIIKKIAEKYHEIEKEYAITSVGVGTPGIIKNGLVNAVNLSFCNTNLKALLEAELGVAVRVANDANCAALGEALCGAGAKFSNIVMISLGTGVGGGIIINGKLYQGGGNAGELGHLITNEGGKKCPCGQMGCLEQYASATALLNMATDEALKNKNSLLYKKYEETGKMNGKVFFEAVQEDCFVAKEVLGEYIKHLATGITSINYMLEPELIVLAGGITNCGDLLLKPLKEAVGENIPVTISTLKSDAGVVGAALLK